MLHLCNGVNYENYLKRGVPGSVENQKYPTFKVIGHFILCLKPIQKGWKQFSSDVSIW